MAAFVDAVASGLGEDGRWLHYGLTSSDVLDTALSLTVREAGALLLAGLDAAFAVVVRRADERTETLCMGRTHGVHAEPITFGLKLAGWAFALGRDRGRLERALEGLRVGKLSGVVGQYAAIDPEVERIACDRLGLEPAPSSTQILQRDRHAELLAALALLASSLDRFATEIRHLSRTEVREVGSRSGVARRDRRPCRTSATRSQPSGSPVSHASCARIRSSGSRTLPSGTTATSRTPPPSASCFPTRSSPWTRCSIASRGSSTAWPYPERMRANVASSHNLFFSQRLLLALVQSGLARGDAYRLVQRLAMRAWDEGLDFVELVRADQELAARLDLVAVFDLGAYTRHVDIVFERLAELVSSREVPVRA